MPDELIHDDTAQAQPDQEEPATAKEQAIRELLRVLDPHPNDAKLSYANVLARLQTVMLREMQAQAALEATAPAVPAMPPAPHTASAPMTGETAEEPPAG